MELCEKLPGVPASTRCIEHRTKHRAADEHIPCHQSHIMRSERQISFALNNFVQIFAPYSDHTKYNWNVTDAIARRRHKTAMKMG